MLVSARYLSLFLLTASALPAIYAQAADIPLRGPIPFEAFDKNGNKMISPKEFVDTHNQRKKMRVDASMPTGRMPADPAFTYFDANGDSQISPEELNMGRGGMRQQRGGMGQGMGRGMNQGQGQGMGRGMNPGQGMNRGMNMPSFADFDLNGDGVLLSEEFYDARAKRMYQRAEQGYPMRNAANAPPFEMLDTNRDRKVTADEFSAHQAEHRRMMMGR